jgi:glycosyltransferase involved in cell wall biosynthesis
MLDNYIIVIPLIHEWDWTADFQKQTGITLKKMGADVIVLETQKRPLNLKRMILNPQKLITTKNNISFISLFHIFPFERFQYVYKLNKRISILIVLFWIKLAHPRKKIILWIFHPMHYWILETAKKIFLKNIVSIYDVVDHFSSGISKSNFANDDNKLLKSADLVTSISKSLAKHLSNVRKDIKIVPQGFRIESHKKSLKVRYLKRGKPLIGFVGGINNRLDYRLLITLIRKNNQWDFVFWGPIQENLVDNKTRKKIKTLLSLPNVIHGLSTNKKQIPSVIRQFDICMIPYDVSMEFNKYSYPMKIFEYFYEGKNVISTNIPELFYYSRYILMSNSVQVWEKSIKKILSHPYSKSVKNKLRYYALLNTWEKKINQVLNCLEYHNEKG